MFSSVTRSRMSAASGLVRTDSTRPEVSSHKLICNRKHCLNHKLQHRPFAKRKSGKLRKPRRANASTLNNRDSWQTGPVWQTSRNRNSSRSLPTRRPWCRTSTNRALRKDHADVSDRSRSRSPDPLVRTRPRAGAPLKTLSLQASSGPRGPDYSLSSPDSDFCQKRQRRSTCLAHRASSNNNRVGHTITQPLAMVREHQTDRGGKRCE